LAVTKQTLQLGWVVTAAHYSPSGVTPTPSPDDARLTLRLCAAADVLDARRVLVDITGTSAQLQPRRLTLTSSDLGRCNKLNT
jgi:DNA repair protein RadC